MQAEAPHYIIVIANATVMNEPAAVYRVRVVVLVLARIARGGEPAVTDQKASIPRHREQGQRINNPARLLEHLEPTTGINPRHAPGMRAERHRQAGDDLQALQVELFTPGHE